MSDTIPEWFWTAVETESEKRTVEVDEIDIFYQRWGDPAKAPLLLIHGKYAHSRWWDFIAPHLLDEYYVVAMDLAGMGDSDYRYDYSADIFAEEILAVMDDAGLGNDCIVAAHSFGGYVSTRAAAVAPDRLQALLLLDSPIMSPKNHARAQRMPNREGGRNPEYPDRETAWRRFRLQPPQPCENQFLVDYIARQSIMRDGDVWVWKFDDDMDSSMAPYHSREDDFRELECKVGLIYGGESKLFTEENASNIEYMQSLRPDGLPVWCLDGAQHHLFLDKPLEFVDLLKRVLTELRG